MTVTADFLAFVLEQLEGLSPASKRMFGGVGIYSGEHFFAIIHDDRLYFKVDDSSRADYVDGGMTAFKPYGDERALGYFEVPIEVLEDPESLAEWARKAIRVAASSKRSSKRPKKPAARGAIRKPRG